ncbi:MAG: PQQ-dependent sugar dehydrogenase [Actinomycetota bacterium]
MATHTSSPATEGAHGACWSLRRPALAVLGLALVVASLIAGPAGAETLPSGFQESTVFSGLTNPTTVRFAPDGRVFVATKSGQIYVYNSITDPTRTLFADLSTNVHDYWDRGLLGLALDPQFPARPYVYVLYTYDHALSSNHITNPDFETDAGGWAENGDPATTMARQTGWSASGAASLRYTATVGAKGWSGAQANQIAVSPGSSYTISATVNVLSLTGAQMVGAVINWNTASGQFIGQDTFGLSQSRGVRTITGAGTAPANAAYGALQVFAANGSGAADFYIDSARFEGPSPAPKWGDQCPSPPGPLTDGCVVTGRLSRLTAAGNAMTGSEQVLLEDWCQQFPSHSIGSLAFAPDNSLYVTGGDGANWNGDYGQTGNPCGDPPGPAGSNLSPPTAEGGALRAQDMRSTADPTGLDGAVLRVDPDTGQGVAGNPYAGSTDANARRIVAYGLRNPFRATVRPGTSELWLGDVGAGAWEEIDRMASPALGLNFGWPCYEGAARTFFDAFNLCQGLYAAGGGAVVEPHFSYHHDSTVAGPGDPCPIGSSTVTGLAFGTNATTYPAPFDRALFFADWARNCIWAMPLGADGLPDPAAVRTFATGLTTGPVDLVIGPGGDLFYVGFDSGTIERISYTAANQAPVAVAKATPTSGITPLTVQFDGTESSDADSGDTLSYAWDLDGDGIYDNSTSSRPTWTYQTNGTYTARLRVTDNHGASATDSVIISAGNTPPTATIATPTSSVRWSVDDVIGFSGSATDPQDGLLPASALSWDLIMHHCPSNCHEHYIQGFSGATGSFSAPDHEYPSYLELRLTATDSGGLKHTQSVRLDPRTVNLTLASSPSNGFNLTLNGVTAKAKFTRTVIQNSSNSISAPNQGQYLFRSWSDGGAQTHQFRAGTSATYTATFRKR